MSAVFEKKVEQWLSDGRPRWQRRMDSLRATWHSYRVPPLGIRWALHVFFRALLIVIPVGIAAHANSLSGLAATVIAVTIIGIQIAIQATNGGFFRTKSDYWDDLDSLLQRVSQILGDMRIKDHMKEEAGSHRRHYQAIASTLTIIEDYVLHMIAANRGEVTVTFAVYDDIQQGKMEIICRNKGSSRPCGPITAPSGMLAHRACVRGILTRPVNDINHFGHEARVSPSGSTVKYRSFLILPLFDNETDHQPFAFVTIDCTIPYAFYGDRAIFLTEALEPFISHIQQRYRKGL